MSIRNPDLSLIPYAASQEPLTPLTTDSHSTWQRIVGAWQGGSWPLVFMLNLALPGVLGFAICRDSSCFGKVLTTIGLLLLTAWFVANKPLLRAKLIAVGKIVVLFQFLTLFHFLIGLRVTH